MSPIFEAVVAKYSWIWIGLTFGFAAKYAMLIKRGMKVRVRMVIADLMILPLVVRMHSVKAADQAASR